MEHEKQFRIPTVLALSVIAGFVALLVTFSDDARIFFGRAQQPSEILPEKVSTYQLNANDTYVFWESQVPVASSLVLNTSPTKTVYDVRDTDSVPKQYKLHIFTVSNLSNNESIKYEIKIANRTVFRGTITGKQSLSNKQPLVVPIYGSVPDDISSSDVFIIASFADGVESALFNPSKKSWAIPLATLRSKDFRSYFCENNACSDETPVKLIFITEDKKVEKNVTIGSSRPYSDTNVLSLETKTESPSPEPTEENPKPTILSPTPTKKINVLSAETKKNTEKISILSPDEGALLTFSKPLFRGEGIAGKDVTLTLSGSITQVGKTQVSEKNTWQWTPGYPLSSGVYSFKAVTTDNNNRKVTLSRAFTILKSGENVLSASTPSATLVPTFAPVETPTPTIFVPSPTPTLFRTAGPALSLFFIGGGSLLMILAFALL